MGTLDYYLTTDVRHLYEYLPVRYHASHDHEVMRRIVYDFKDGIVSERLFERLCSEIESILSQHDSTNKERCIIAFIPASSKTKTILRYHKLAEKLSKKYNVRFDAVHNVVDRESTMKTGKVENPASGFGIKKSEVEQKHVILIDDVYTTGNSFRRTVELLRNNGAWDIHGLFIAKTINPDWNN